MERDGGAFTRVAQGHLHHSVRSTREEGEGCGLLSSVGHKSLVEHVVILEENMSEILYFNSNFFNSIKPWS